MRGGVIMGAALLALAACGRGGSEADRQAASGNVSVSGAPADIRISTANGTASIQTGGALAGLPEGIPAYPNVDAGQNVDINGGSAPGQGRIQSFSTRDAPAQVIAFYAQAVGRRRLHDRQSDGHGRDRHAERAARRRPGGQYRRHPGRRRHARADHRRGGSRIV